MTLFTPAEHHAFVPPERSAMKTTTAFLLSFAAAACTAAAPIVLPPPLPPVRPTTGPTGTIAGEVFKDANANGLLDASELPLGGVTVSLDGGGVSRSAKAGQDGRFAFAGLPAGTYRLRQATLISFAPTGPAVAGYSVTLTAGQQADGYNFGDVGIVPATPARATLPTTAPAVQGGIVCGCGTSAGPVGVYNAGQAPCVGWFDVRPLCTTRGHVRRWSISAPQEIRPSPKHLIDPADYPVPTVDPATCLNTDVIAIPFDTAGTFTVACTITDRASGTSTMYSQAVVVTPDARAQIHLSSTAAGPFVLAAQLSNTHVFLPPGFTADCTSFAAIRLGTNTVIDGDPTTPAVLTTGSHALFDGWNGQTRNVLIRHVTATSIGTSKAINGVVCQIAPGEAQMLHMRGQNVALVDCSFGCLARGASMDDTTADGFAVIGCRQLDALSMTGQDLSIWSEAAGGRAFVGFDQLLDAINEGVVRFDTKNSGTGTAVTNCLIAQTNPVAGDKAAVDVRNCERLCVTDNAIVNAQVTTSSTIGSADTLAHDALISGNVFRLTAPTRNGCWCDSKGRSADVLVTGNDFGPGIADPVHGLGEADVTDLVVTGNNR